MSRLLRLVGFWAAAIAAGLGIAQLTGVLRDAAGRSPAVVVDDRTPLYREFRERSRKALENPPQHPSEPMPSGHEDRG